MNLDSIGLNVPIPTSKFIYLIILFSTSSLEIIFLLKCRPAVEAATEKPPELKSA